MKDNAFSISYSGGLKDELEQFKTKYAPKETTERMRRLRALDKKVDFIAAMVSIAVGMFGSALLIAGTVFLIKAVFTIFVSCLLIVPGTAIIAVVPFIHSRTYIFIKNLYAPEILRLIDEIERNSP